jgi:hypothetical protein
VVRRLNELSKDGTDDPISRINEIEKVDEYEFAVRPPNEKLEYINRRGYGITKDQGHGIV